MAVPALAGAPVLSTPDTHIFEDPTPAVDTSKLQRLSDEQVALTYEIERTVKEIREGRWNRIALQFPDHMLVDAPRVYEQLGRGLAKAKQAQGASAGAGASASASASANANATESRRNGTAVEELSAKLETKMGLEEKPDGEERLFILGDTSYGACCVDEVAAEHVDADCVVHYGRSCLSPPSRLPVIYVFTERPLDLDQTIATFQSTYPDKAQQVILMADIPYSHHIPALHTRLEQAGYTSLFSTQILHNPSSPLPNRTTPPGTSDALLDWALFHISEPPTSLLLTLSSRVASTHIYPTIPSSTLPAAEVANTRMNLRRRYALCTSLSTTPVFGILINTLSVKNYMTILAHVQKTIAAVGKKSYTFVVGKVNAAKVANFSEVGGWVVIGCWESSLIESKDFWRPLITPFELEIALQDDTNRVWTGEWSGDFTAILDDAQANEAKAAEEKTNGTSSKQERGETNGNADGDYDSEEESAPPEFDLRTGRYVSHSRPMQQSTPSNPKSIQNPSLSSTSASSTALTKRTSGALASVNGVVSPGAEFLRSKRTWVGLGSDYNNTDGEEDGSASGSGHAAKMEEGRSGIARGYHVGEDAEKH
ncbi:Diphthamide biosynthesis protein 2 [Ascochyta rabiei]|uniref:2-(3-amino-3-carboxypropyl)histidine synthase subunit 2 n=1 Tax=Didymella rabiei TaxID=5454 RepID=A0A163J071_DIDRA|nr:Diphthamide biosynthesis protein 2 [Ascochyta rabiei]KZM26057.1 peptidyl-diphthamide biosynthetic process from peptidyl-histidine [Ascochyta rabiei]UPX15425.1 Diphthamide biosynthesis protein 2 [Ascochyta rabiei]